MLNYYLFSTKPADLDMFFFIPGIAGRNAWRGLAVLLFVNFLMLILPLVLGVVNFR